ncbi:MAG TPA: type IV conjugative transfer system lipoprotein TraV [Gammaproteobacteria bacterium]|nr:type IV conjugative transfer system lipoprotein TraV [Gammaproteobacteria bacterium]
MTMLSLIRKPPFFYVSLLFLFLTGCTGLNSNFSCPLQPGVQCNSLDQVNTMIDQGKIGAKSTGNSNALTTVPSQSVLSANLPTAFANFVGMRYPETVMRIWVAPYQDQDGNYHQPGALYSVVKPGRWVNNPVLATDNS